MHPLIPHILAEVSDKEPTAFDFWTACGVLVVVSIIAVVLTGRRDLRFVPLTVVLFTVINAVVMFLVGPEFDDPYVGPALLHENGPGFEISYRCAVITAAAVPTIAGIGAAGVSRIRARRRQRR